MVFMGRGFTSGWQESESVCLAHLYAKCKLGRATLSAERWSCFSQGERFTVQLPLDCALSLWK